MANQGKQRTKRLKTVMVEHDLTPDDVAELVDVSLHTVYAWQARSRGAIPSNLLELLELKLSDSRQVG